MKTNSTNHTKSTILNIIPIIVDIVAMVLAIFLIPRLADRFLQRSVANAVLIAVVYLLFCASVYFLKKLGSEEQSEGWQKGSSLAVLGIFFGIMVTYMMAETAGVFDDLDILDAVNPENPLHSLGIVVGTLLWLVIAMLYAGIMAAAIRPSIPEGTGQYALVEILGLVGINLMIIVAMAGWESIFADTEPYDSIGFGAKVLIFLLAYFFFLLFFAPPRLVFVAKRPGAASVVTFLIQTAYYVWRFVSTTAW